MDRKPHTEIHLERERPPRATVGRRIASGGSERPPVGGPDDLPSDREIDEVPAPIGCCGHAIHSFSPLTAAA